jgi:transaldolase
MTAAAQDARSATPALLGPAGESGEFERLLRDFAVTGATSNPTILAKAITTSDRDDVQIRAAVRNGIVDPRELFFLLALGDVRRAADLLRGRHAARACRPRPRRSDG